MHERSQRQRLRALREEGVRPRKQLGQHFLTDARMARRIVETIELPANSTVVEIGPGLGALTEHLVGRAHRLIAVELDAVMHRQLTARFGDRPDVTLLHQDILTFDFAGLRDVVVVGAIPYQITSPLLFHLLNHRRVVNSAWLVIQREVAQRLVAKPGTKAYGRLSCAAQYATLPRLCFTIAPGAFAPPPKVESALIHLRVREQPAVAVGDEARFFEVIAAAFGHRRKTLLNSLLHDPAFADRKPGVVAAIAAAGLRPDQRGETLSLTQFARLTDQLFGGSASD